MAENVKLLNKSLKSPLTCFGIDMQTPFQALQTYKNLVMQISVLLPIQLKSLLNITDSWTMRCITLIQQGIFGRTLRIKRSSI